MAHTLKKVLVVGATGDIGAQVAKLFASRGYFVYIHYHTNHTKAKKLLAEIKNGELIQFDMTDKTAIKNSLENLSVDILINSSGITRDNLLFFMTDEQWSDVIDTNLGGNYFVTKAIATNMIKQKSGTIVNIASISGICGNTGQANYSASKGGIIALTKTLSLELARYNIRVNAVAPGVINSSMSAEIPNQKSLISHIPMGRFGEPAEVAVATYFMAVEATYTTGQVLNICGGMCRG